MRVIKFIIFATLVLTTLGEDNLRGLVTINANLSSVAAATAAANALATTKAATAAALSTTNAAAITAANAAKAAALASAVGATASLGALSAGTLGASATTASMVELAKKAACLQNLSIKAKAAGTTVTTASAKLSCSSNYLYSIFGFLMIALAFIF